MGIFEQISWFAPEILLALGSMALLIGGVLVDEKSSRFVASGASALLLAAFLAVVAVYPPAPVLLFDGAFRIDAFSSFCKLIIFAAAAIAVLMADRFETGGDLGKFEYPVLIALAALGMSLMASANDLIALYMAVETQSLALYILAAFNRDSRRSTEAGLKYFVLGALSSCLLLYGASLVYGFAGSTNFAAIAEAAKAGGANVGLIVGLVFLICGLAFKVSAAPFHMWTPDVYEGAPTPVTAFFAAAPKFAAMALFTRTLVSGFGGSIEDWRPVIAALAVASMAVGAFSAIAQTNIKRLMAYSSIGHMGFALIGLAAGAQNGVASVLLYMTIYIAMTIGTFACILLMRRRGGHTEGIEDLAGLSQNNLGLALALSAMLFSLAGIPVFAGFFGKLFVFQAAVDAGLVWLAVVGAIASVISAFYYLRIVWIIWFDEPAPAFEREAGGRLGLIALVATLLMFPVMVVFMGPLRGAAATAASALF